MMKFFRKHNKELLAVFMALLMIVFVGGSALQSLLAPSYDRQHATCDFGEIRDSDLMRANATVQILSRLGVNWGALGFVNGPPEPMDWHLLCEEAKRAGMVPDVAATTPINPDKIRNYKIIAQRLKIKPEVIYQARADLLGVDMARRALTVASLPGEATIRTAIYNSQEKAKVRALKLPASAFVDGEAAVDDAELEAQLAKYRETEPGVGLNFGYVVPPSVKVEYIKIDAKALAAKLPDSTVLKRARRYYQRNPNDPRFARPKDTVEEADAEADEAKEEDAPLTLPWEDVKDRAIEIVREEEGKAQAKEFANLLLGWAREPWDYAERDKDTRYRVAPEGADAEDLYTKLVARLAKSKKMDLASAVTVERTSFHRKDELLDIPGLGPAVFPMDRGPNLAARELLRRVQPIQKIMPKDQGTNPDNYLALFETATVPFRGTTGDWYVMRVIEVKDEHPAESLDEVRDYVLADVRTMRGYEQAKTHAADILAKLDSYEGTEEANRLQQALDATETLADLGPSVSVLEPNPFGRTDEWAMMRGRQASGSGTFVQAGTLGRLPQETVKDIFKLGEGGASQAGIIEVKEQAAVYVVDWVELVPCREDQFESRRRNVAQIVTAMDRRAAMQDWFSSEKVHKRCGLEFPEG